MFGLRYMKGALVKSAGDSYVWGGETKEQLAKRNAMIRHLDQEGSPRAKIAKLVGLTQSRVGQIIRGQGK